MLTETNRIKALERLVQTSFDRWNALKQRQCTDNAVLDPLVRQYQQAKKQLAAAQKELDERLLEEYRCVLPPHVAQHLRLVDGHPLFEREPGFGIWIFGAPEPPVKPEDCDFSDD